MRINMRWENFKMICIQKMFYKFITSTVSSYLTQNELNFFSVDVFLLFEYVQISYMAVHLWNFHMFLYAYIISDVCLKHQFCFLFVRLHEIMFYFEYKHWCTNHKIVVLVLCLTNSSLRVYMNWNLIENFLGIIKQALDVDNL